MLIRFVLTFTLAFIPFLVVISSVEPVLAGTCSVETIVRLVHKGQDRNQIRRKCDKAKVKRCSLSQVVRMAENGLTVRDIYEKCGRG